MVDTDKRSLLDLHTYLRAYMENGNDFLEKHG